MKRRWNLTLSSAAALSPRILSYLPNCASVLLIFILGSTPAFATLGQTEASVTSDQQEMKMEERVHRLKAYNVHELTNANGTIVREYVSPQGSVFGITWHGSSVPDMNQLLGTYVNNLQTATPDQTKIQRHRGITIKTNDFVYSNFCHLRICAGSAYVPKLLPENVTAEVVR